MPRPRIVAVTAVATALTATVLGSSLVLGQKHAGIDDIMAIREADAGEVVATVNGVQIKAAEVAIAQLWKGITNPDEGRHGAGEALDELIRSELLFQEAQGRGLVPPDDAVWEALAQTKRDLLAAIESGEAPPAVIKHHEEVKDTPYAIETYDTSEEAFRVFQRSMATEALLSEVIATLPLADQHDKAKVDAAIKAFTEELAKDAIIERR